MRLLRLCAALERIADGLPGVHSKTGKVLSFLDKAFARHVFIHEKCLFPLIRSLEDNKEPTELILRQLEFEHAADRGLIVEIACAYMGRMAGNAGYEAQMFGYMLRAFFENYRRHCAWERNVLYPLARKILVTGEPRKHHDALFRLSAGSMEPEALLRLAAVC